MRSRRHVLAALAAGIAAGNEDAARAQIATIDWVLRRSARRRLELALIDAALATLALPPDAAHVQRVAALDVARRRRIDPCDPAAVSAAYAALPVVPPARAPIATILAALGALLTIASLVAYLATRPGPASRTYTRPQPPPAAGAFKDGGVPLRDPAVEALLVGPFTDYVLLVDVDRRSFGKKTAERRAAAAALVDAPAMARTPALHAAWGALVTMFDRWVSLPLSSPAFDDVAREVRQKARAVSDQLGALGLGYYVEGDVFGGSDTAHAVVYSYRVEEVVLLVTNGHPRRVLSLRRLDQINLSHALLGMESQDLGDPLVLVDQVDKHVATYVLPALAPGAAFPLADARWIDATGLGRAAGDATRRELAAALGPDADAAATIGALLVERGALLDRWRGLLEARDLRLATVRDLFLPPAMLDQLANLIPASERDRAREIDEEIARLAGPRIASRVQELVVRSVRHHEAQHGVDEDRASALAYPAALADHVGTMTTAKGEPRPAAEHANLELSAYLSQLANDLLTPQLVVWDLAQHAFNEDGWGTVESYVAVVVLDGLARHLDRAPPGPAPAPIIHDGIVDRALLATRIARLPARSGAELRAAAQALYVELYGEKVAAITPASLPITDR
ncbi:MAG: hypothetical protein NT062_18200 [Proteobacteria bacterium]|nr:hypothetical protein [Pseudomonadota bacterium]